MTNRIGAGRDTHISTTMKAIFLSFGEDQSNVPTALTGNYQVQDSTGQPIDFVTVYPIYSGGESFPQLRALADTAFLAYAASKSYGMTQADIEGPTDGFALALPMLVSGVAKLNTYSIAAQPTIAGGAGVARFYTDSNGDGTGTAPSEIEISTLQAYVVNGSAVYGIGAVTVDTNRKYIDITMKTLSFASTILSLITVLTGATFGAAANGIVVNCFVIVKK